MEFLSHAHAFCDYLRVDGEFDLVLLAQRVRDVDDERRVRQIDVGRRLRAHGGRDGLETELMKGTSPSSRLPAYPDDPRRPRSNVRVVVLEGSESACANDLPSFWQYSRSCVSREF